MTKQPGSSEVRPCPPLRGTPVRAPQIPVPRLPVNAQPQRTQEMDDMSTQRAKGTRLEKLTAEYLAARLGDDRIERRAGNGANDRGDITGVRTPLGERVVVEVKNHARLDLAGWAAEVAVEKGNDDAPCGVIVHKRHGRGRAADQWVTMTLADFAVLLGGAS